MKIKIKLKDLYKIIEQNIDPDVQNVANMLNELFPLEQALKNVATWQARQIAARQQPIQQLRLKLASDLVALRELCRKRNDITDLDVTYNIIQLLNRYQSVNVNVGVGYSQPVNVDIDVNDNENIRTILKNIFGDIKLAQHQPGNQLKKLIAPQKL